MENQRETILAWLGNSVSLGAIVTTFAGLTPAIAALVAVIWYSVQIYESATVQRWLSSRRRRRIAILRAKIAALEVELSLMPPEKDDPDDTGI